MGDSVANGSCLCGAVKIQTSAFDGTLGACHCDYCRKWSGAALLAVNFGSSPKIDGEVSWYSSSERADRGFCPRCGTHLFVRVRHDNRHLVPPGVLDDSDSGVRFDHQIFIDRKPDYYSYSNSTTNMTSTQVMGEQSEFRAARGRRSTRRAGRRTGWPDRSVPPL